MSQTETYDVGGMTCDHRVRAVAEDVLAIPGVSQVAVDLRAGQVHVTTHGTVPATEIREAVEEAGYALA
jgi:copper chaperone CopZ